MRDGARISTWVTLWRWGVEKHRWDDAFPALHLQDARKQSTALTYFTPSVVGRPRLPVSVPLGAIRQKKIFSCAVKHLRLLAGGSHSFNLCPCPLSRATKCPTALLLPLPLLFVRREPQAAYPVYHALRQARWSRDTLRHITCIPNEPTRPSSSELPRSSTRYSSSREAAAYG